MHEGGGRLNEQASRLKVSNNTMYELLMKGERHGYKKGNVVETKKNEHGEQSHVVIEQHYFSKDVKVEQLFLCISLGGNSYLHPYIDNLYRKKEWEYYEAYQQSALKENPVFSMYTTKSEEKIRQIAGILEWSNRTGQYVQLDQLIKRGYKFAYQYFRQHEQIDLEDFMRSYAKRKKIKIVKEIELLYQNIVLWYLCVREKKWLNTDNVAWKSFQEIMSGAINESQVQKSMFSKEICHKHRKELDQLYIEYNIPTNHRFDSLGFFLEYLIGQCFKKIYDVHPNCHLEMAEERVFQRSPANYIGALGGWLKTLKIHELDATEQIPFTKQDLDIVFLELLYAKKYNYISKENQDLFLISCLYVKCLSSLYLETKELYLDKSKLDYYYEMKAKEEQIVQKEAALSQQQKKWEIANQHKEDKIEGLTEELRQAHSKIRQLEQQIQSMEDYRHEVHALRKFAYLAEHDETSLESEPSLETMVQFIQSKRLVIFGGHSSWRQKLREQLSNVEFVDVDEMNRDISKVKRVDAVFINTSVFAHAFYKKVLKALSNSETPQFYLNRQNNVEKTISEIYKWLTE